MSILFPQQNQDYTLMSEKTNFKTLVTGEEIPENRIVVTRKPDTTIFSTSGPSVTQALDTEIYGTRRYLTKITTGAYFVAKDLIFQLKGVGSNSDLKIDIYNLDDNDLPTGSIIQTFTLQSAEFQGTYAYEKVSLGNLKLEPYTSYGIVFRQTLDLGDSNNYISLRAGHLYGFKYLLSTDGGDNWNQDANNGLVVWVNYYGIQEDRAYLGISTGFNVANSVLYYESDSYTQNDYYDDYIGFSKNTALKDGLVTVQTEGIVTVNKDSSGNDLVPGTIYYFDNSGKVKTNVNNNGKAGEAVDINKLIIIRQI